MARRDACRAGARERVDLRVRLPAPLVPSAPNDLSVKDNDRADHRVRPRRARTAPRELERLAHEALVVIPFFEFRLRHKKTPNPAMTVFGVVYRVVTPQAGFIG